MFFRTIIRRLIAEAPASIRRDIILAGIAAADNLSGYSSYPNLRNTLLTLRRKGFAPRTAIDVGSFIGEWTILWKQLFPECRVVMIEPLESKHHGLEVLCEEYKESVCLVKSVAAALDGADVVFHEMENASSVYKERSGPLSGSSVTRSTITIDKVKNLHFESDECLDFLKLDTQGYEIEVLKGAQRTLERTHFVLAEASLIAINEGCPLIDELMTYMSTRGFRLYDICGQWRRPDHVLWQVDLLFVNEKCRFLPETKLQGKTFSDWTFSNGNGE